ncbi:LysE family translocator [Streptomyces sp. NPDC001205]
MIHPYAVLGFLVAVLPLVATPGASLALLVQHVTDNGRRQALPVILGTTTGLYVHATFAIAGLSALVMHSSQAFTAVKVIGASYLIGLALWTWRSATVSASAPSRRHLPVRSDSVYTQALLANVLNPKAASIYLTLVPQFIEADHSFDAQILALAYGRQDHRRGVSCTRDPNRRDVGQQPPSESLPVPERRCPFFVDTGPRPDTRLVSAR